MSLSLYRVTQGNFGDDLNERLIRPLMPAGTSTRYLNASTYEKGHPEEMLVVGIGTILNRRIPRYSSKIVFGSGAGYGPAPSLDDRWDVRFVRGPKTADRLGLHGSEALTDPGILVRDWVDTHLDAPVAGSGGVCLMLHLGSANAAWEQLCRELGITYLHPADDVTRTLRTIRQARLVLAEAMHAAIAADALRVPWIPIRSGPAVNEFKWQDWCASMNLEYRPTLVLPIWSTTQGARLRSGYQRWKAALNRHALRRLVSGEKAVLSDEATHRGRLESVREASERLRDDLAQWYGAKEGLPLSRDGHDGWYCNNREPT